MWDTLWIVFERESPHQDTKFLKPVREKSVYLHKTKSFYKEKRSVKKSKTKRHTKKNIFNTLHKGRVSSGVSTRNQ